MKTRETCRTEGGDTFLAVMGHFVHLLTHAQRPWVLGSLYKFKLLLLFHMEAAKCMDDSIQLKVHKVQNRKMTPEQSRTMKTESERGSTIHANFD